jgi:hypothetical protein
LVFFEEIEIKKKKTEESQKFYEEKLFLCYFFYYFMIIQNSLRKHRLVWVTTKDFFIDLVYWLF